jgi:hypothetical protein
VEAPAVDGSDGAPEIPAAGEALGAEPPPVARVPATPATEELPDVPAGGAFGAGELPPLLVSEGEELAGAVPASLHAATETRKAPSA